MTDMSASTPSSKTARTASPKEAAPPKTARRAVSPRRSKAAELLREIQIDGKALSVQIERLRHRFL
jgi:hypothetical protein